MVSSKDAKLAMRFTNTALMSNACDAIPYSVQMSSSTALSGLRLPTIYV